MDEHCCLLFHSLSHPDHFIPHMYASDSILCLRPAVLAGKDDDNDDYDDDEGGGGAKEVLAICSCTIIVLRYFEVDAL